MIPLPLRPSIHPIATTIHGRYLVRATEAPPSACSLAATGTGQTAEGFASDLERIRASIAGCSSRCRASIASTRARSDVVASWMTSQDRELMIADNIAYLRQVVAHVRGDQVPALRPHAPLVFLGFSQGVAMAFRAAADRSHGAQALSRSPVTSPPDVRASAASLPPVLLGGDAPRVVPRPSGWRAT